VLGASNYTYVEARGTQALPDWIGAHVHMFATEGLALTGFSRAAKLLLRDHERNHPAADNMKVLLGECLAVAVLHDARYRQVAQRYLDLETPDSEDPVLGFVVVRAYSKLAEIDPALIDLGALLRVATELDTGCREAFTFHGSKSRG
jgi:hypothetical protein